jgi:hypothetical protein
MNIYKENIEIGITGYETNYKVSVYKIDNENEDKRYYGMMFTADNLRTLEDCYFQVAMFFASKSNRVKFQFVMSEIK